MSTHTALGALLAFRSATDGWIGSWSPGIGDPTVWGWLTVVAYLVSAWISYRLARGNLVSSPRERLVWSILAVCLLLLGINKQLDAQSALTEMGRLIARSEGWYERRRVVQVAFIVGFSVVAAAGAGTLFAVTRRLPRATRVAVLGGVLVIIFVVIRASSFHKMDRLIRLAPGGARLNWLLELGGLSIVLAGARWRAASPDPPGVPRGGP